MFKFLVLVSCIFAVAFALPTPEKEKDEVKPAAVHPAWGYPGYGVPAYGYGRGYWPGAPAAGYNGYLGGYAGYPGLAGYPYGAGYNNYGYGQYFGQY